MSVMAEGIEGMLAVQIIACCKTSPLIKLIAYGLLIDETINTHLRQPAIWAVIYRLDDAHFLHDSFIPFVSSLVT